MRRRVVVTGIGIVSPLGLSAADHFDALVAGRHGIAPLAAFPTGDFPVRYAAELKEFRANRFLKNRKSVKVMARDIQIAVAAASLAAREAGIHEGADRPERFGVVMGAGLMPTEIDDVAPAFAVSRGDDGRFDLRKYGKEGLAATQPLWLLKYLPNMLNAHIAIEYDAQGPDNCLTCGNAGGVMAVGEAARIIERGDADYMMAGSAESKVHPVSLVRLFIGGKLSTAADLAERGPRPFAPDRSGAVVGEGGAVLILEEESHARARGAKVYAEVAGFASSCGSQLVEEVSSEGRAAKEAMMKALRRRRRRGIASERGLRQRLGSGRGRRRGARPLGGARRRGGGHNREGGLRARDGGSGRDRRGDRVHGYRPRRPAGDVRSGRVGPRRRRAVGGARDAARRRARQRLHLRRADLERGLQAVRGLASAAWARTGKGSS